MQYVQHHNPAKSKHQLIHIIYDSSKSKHGLRDKRDLQCHIQGQEPYPWEGLPSYEDEQEEALGVLNPKGSNLAPSTCPNHHLNYYHYLIHQGKEGTHLGLKATN